MTCTLTDRYTLALNLMMEHCGQMVRKADKTPYAGHLLRVSGLVMEGGGDEEAAIGGLTHDFIEDVEGGQQILLDALGQTTVDVVLECSDTDTRPKPPWQERKERHIAHIDEVSERGLRILLADKLDNGRSLVVLANYAGKAFVEQNFNSTPAQQIWYFKAMHDAIRANSDDVSGITPQVDELGEIAEKLAWLLE
jgi:(p)ppGpp synthase/HD superfamily hydrolase